MSWHRHALVGFGLETTGTTSPRARIITAAAVRADGDRVSPRAA
ncbi:hypothetical protein [Streptomyces sp. NPDC058382]